MRKYVIPALLVLALLCSGCALFQTRDLRQDYASALRVYTGVTVLATDAVAKGLIPKAQLPKVKTASDSAFAALNLMKAAVNANDNGTYDSYFAVFTEALNTINTILKGVKDEGSNGASSPVGG